MTSGPPIRAMSAPCRATASRAPQGRAGASSPGGPSGGGGWHSSAGIYYSVQDTTLLGNTGPYFFPQVQGSGIIGSTTIGNDVWNPVEPLTQTLFAANPGQWEIIANFPAGNTAVSSYPSNSQSYSDPLNVSDPFLLNSVTSFYSSFDENQPQNPGVISEAAYDTWWNAFADEIMIQHDMTDPSGQRGAFETIDTAMFGGAGGVPVQEWSLGIFGAEIIWQLTEGTGEFGGGITAGTVDIRSMINWLADRGYMVNGLNSPLVQIGYGWEICSTGAQDVLYRVNGFSSSFTYEPPETSPPLELSGFAVTGPGPHDVINSVTVTVAEYQSDTSAQPCLISLWDYSSGSGVQVGTTRYGARSTDTANQSQATFYSGVTYGMLATLRVQVAGYSATGRTESVAGVALSVNYTPGYAQAPAAPGMRNIPVTVPVRAGVR